MVYQSVVCLIVLLLLQVFECPGWHPWDGHLACGLVYLERQPNVAAVGKVFLLPHVEAGDELPFLGVDRDDVGALSVECLVGVDACAWVAEYGPFAHDAVGYGEFCLVRVPSCATA